MSAAQLDIFEDPWVTGERPCTDGPYAYVIAIRSPSDPERSSRELRDASERGAASTHRVATMRKAQNADPAALRETLLGLLREHGEQTFNALCVRGWRCTADMLCGGAQEDALWRLVEAGLVEYTWTAPVLFRLRRTRP